MILHPWTRQTSAGFALRGWHSAPSGKPVLHFLHGTGFCARTYEPMLTLLAGSFDLWLCDVQGHGDSDQNGRFHGWNRSAELAQEAFDAGRGIFGDAPRYATGHSFGGVMTCFILARQPGLFQRAVLLDPVLFSPTMIVSMAFSEIVGWTGANPLVSKTLRRRPHWPDRAAAYADLHGRGIFKGWTEAALWAYVEHALKEAKDGVELKCRPSLEAAVFSAYPKRLWSSLGKITTPTLLLHGQDSYPFVGKSATRWCAMNPSISSQMVPGGHCFMQQFPDESAHRIVDFLLR